jgi:transposase
MLTPENVFLAVKPVDMRRGIDTLTRIKVLRRDKHGVWLCTRRLHKGHFHWPRANDAAWSLTPDQFEWLITGIDWQRMHGNNLAKWVFREEELPSALHL